MSGPKDERVSKRIVVKGYLRPDGASYYVSIPKEVRQLLDLHGGEYFLMETKPEKREISLKILL